MCPFIRKRPRSPNADEIVHDPARETVTPVCEDRKRKHLRTTTKLAEREEDDEVAEYATSVHRDEIVAALFTICSALGLASETLHMCVDLLDRYMQRQQVESSRLEKLSIACLWLAVKFVETPLTIEEKRIKSILKRRRHSGHWTWAEILELEGDVLKCLDMRLMGPTILRAIQHKIFEAKDWITPQQIQTAYYFTDLLLLKDRANQYPKDTLADAIWYVLLGNQIQDVEEPLLAPVVIIFLAHRDNIDANHAMYKAWFALRCKHGASLQAPWQVPYDDTCTCRVCANVKAQLACADAPTSDFRL
ncbi:TPA: hypothetical protein N0F65_011644 [Lagenidium giganteum]|uniref:Cyclin-like domain-containing protein n=1 Tax=Lagenidium giganteum TaxID=4803 RepID=A0AAV2ZBH2_9STRA|nr:TPA: hypothetical protein N0F65_011644 [Lagenidium giganteum]